MGTGYTRNDTSNNIADGNIINAADLDGEFDAVESAFNSSTGHTHDGTAAEGGAITVVGPVQDLVVSATEVKPKTTNTLDLGTSALLYKDAYLQGNMYFRDTALKIVSSADGQLDIDADVELELVAPTVDIDASTALTVDTASTTFTSTLFNVTGSANITGDLDVDNININGNTIISTDTNGAINITPNGTGAVNITATTNITGDLDVDNININGNTIISTDTNGDINISPDGTGTVVIDTDLDVDNINVNGNTVSSTDTNGDINLSPNGTGTVVINTDLDVDNININGNTIISTDTNGNIALTPNGTGEVDISKVDIASGEIDGTTIGANSAAAGTFTNLTSTGTSTHATVDINGGNIDGTIIGASSAAAITGTTITGTSFVSSGDMTFGDNDKAIFGAGSDLQIYHDGFNSYVDDAGAGSLYIRSDGVMQIQKYTGEVMQTLAADGAVTLYYDNVPKIITTATGVDVTGVITTDGLTTSADINFGDNDKAIFGAGSDLQIYHDGANSVIDDTAGGRLYLRSDPGVIISKYTGEVCAQFNADADVKLYYDNAEKFATTSDGIDVTGTATIDAGSATGTHLQVTTTGSGHNFDMVDSSSTARIRNVSGILRIGADHNNEAADSAIRFDVDDSEAMRIDSSGNVGIGTTSPQNLLQIEGSSGTAPSQLRLGVTSGGQYYDIGRDFNDGLMTFYSGQASPYTGYKWSINAGSEAMRIDSSGNLLVGTTDTNPASNNVAGGIALRESGQVNVSRDNNPPLQLNRKTADGDIALFQKDGSTVGSIGANSGDLTIDGAASHSGLRFLTTYIQPRLNGSVSNGGVDLGAGAARFDDIFAVNATIQTSDANEKQQIATLTDAEMTAAKAISQLFKTFKWNSAVTEKGDAARTHAGVIAQDVQAAMTDAGLDAGDYAFFISTTWWETQTDVPAVEAADAVLDDDGNVVTEAVEAVDAYTRTDTYDTAEEAPEGATECTRLGIRYPELLAFVGAATEQRLANIETRLTALENA